MAETNEKGEPHIPTALILRMQLGSGAYRLSAGTLTSAEREPISTPGAGRSMTKRYCGQSMWRPCAEREPSRTSCRLSARPIFPVTG